MRRLGSSTLSSARCRAMEIPLARTRLAQADAVGSRPSGAARQRPRCAADRCIAFQYVARPPEMSNTAPVLKAQSSEASQTTSDAASATCRKRPIGIFDSM